jgi:hypothetical protein
VIARQLAEPQARSSPPARKGRSEAEWLDGAENRRTISRRDGRGSRALGARQRTRKGIEARWWKKGRRRRSSAAAVTIQSECALTLKNAGFRRNLTGESIRTSRLKHAAARSTNDSGCVHFRPDERDKQVGRERPPPDGAWGEEGGNEVGVAHAPAVALLGCDSGADSIPAAQSAAGTRPETPDWQEHRGSIALQKTSRAVDSANDPCVGQGNGAPEFRFPHPVPPSRVQTRVTRQGEGSPSDSCGDGY